MTRTPQRLRSAVVTPSPETTSLTPNLAHPARGAPILQDRELRSRNTSRDARPLQPPSTNALVTSIPSRVRTAASPSRTAPPSAARDLGGRARRRKSARLLGTEGADLVTLPNKLPRSQGTSRSPSWRQRLPTRHADTRTVRMHSPRSPRHSCQNIQPGSWEVNKLNVQT